MAKKILGIDLGTNSLGWAVLDESRNPEYPYVLSRSGNKLNSGVLVFPSVIDDDQTGQTLAAVRRGFRSTRRLIFRRKWRKYETLKVLAANHLAPVSTEEVEKWRGTKNEFRRFPSSEVFLRWLTTDEAGKKNPYYYRDKVSRQSIDFDNERERHELGRALYHMAQRRGFKSNRLDATDKNLVQEIKDEWLDYVRELKYITAEQYLGEIADFLLDKGYDVRNNKKSEMPDANGQRLYTIYKSIEREVKKHLKKKPVDIRAIEKSVLEILQTPEKRTKIEEGIHELSEAIKASGVDTLGQYFWQLYQQDRHENSNKIRGRYTARDEHYLHEFDVIMQKQFPDLVHKQYDLKNPKKRYSGVALDLYKAIFFQRPLKSQKGKIGKCTLEPDKPRVAISHYLFEEFRMWQFINSIKIKLPDESEARFLNEEERKKIEPLFYRKKERFEFKDIIKQFIPKNLLDQVKHTSDQYLDGFPAFNYRDTHKISANYVSARLKDVLGDKWNKVYKKQKHRKEGAGEKEIEITYNELAWHALFTFDDDEKLKEFAIGKLGLTPEQASKFVKIKLPQGYASLSLKAIRKILPWLREGYLYSHAVFLANLPYILDKEHWTRYREEIIEGLGDILDNHRRNKWIAEAINSMITRNRQLPVGERINFSKEAAPYIRKDLEEAIIKYVGKHRWEEWDDREAVLDEALELLKEQLRKNPLKGGEYLKIYTLEEAVKAFLTGENETGTVYCRKPKRLEWLYHPSKLEKYQPVKGYTKGGKKINLLPDFQTSQIPNPTLKRAMNYLKKLVNRLLREGIIDNETRVHIEMAREINSFNMKKAIEQYQQEWQTKREEAKRKLEEFLVVKNKTGIKITDDLIDKYILRDEQKGVCVYTGREIDMTDVFNFPGARPVDIEHTIPRSRSWDNSMQNKTLADADFQRNKKRNRIPYELGEEKMKEILPRIEHWRQTYLNLEKEIADLRVNPAMEDRVRNRIIQKRYLKQLWRDYYKGKYERFRMKDVPEGFKHNQLTATGLITKTAFEYLGSVFRNRNGNPNVFTVNGTSVSVMRELWGLDDKTREFHTHHMVDAVTAAAISKQLYEKLAQIWSKEDEHKQKMNKLLRDKHYYKPWKTFTEDMKKAEEEILAVHRYKDNVGKNTKIKIRRRGRVVHRRVRELPEEYKHKIPGKDYRVLKIKGKTYYELPEPMYRQGDTARGALFKQNFYGKILEPGTQTVRQVIRKELDKLKSGDVKNIVDPEVKKIIQRAVDDGMIKFTTTGATVKDTIWMNEEKGIPIKKVRIYFKQGVVDVKPHPEIFLSNYEHKQKLYAQSGANYLMVIYEHPETGRREKKLVNLIDTYRLRKEHLPPYEENIEVKGKYYKVAKQNGRDLVLKKGLAVILLRSGEQVEYNDYDWLYKRLYYIQGLDDDGIKLMHHAYAMGTSKALQHMNRILNNEKKEKILEEMRNLGVDEASISSWENEYRTKEDTNKISEWFKAVNHFLNKLYLQQGLEKKANYKKSNLTTPKGDLESFMDKPTRFPYVKMQPNDFNAKIEGIDFKVEEDGIITEMT